MPTLDLPGGRLDYEVAGRSGPLVAQLHGLTSSRHRDARLGLDLPRALSRAHRVLRYDARAHGASTGTAHASHYTWPRLADDLLAVLERVAPRERVHGVGPSMGAGTLLHAAVRDPGRFSSLTLVTPPTAWETRRAQTATYLANADLVEQDGIGAFIEVGLVAPTVPALADAPHTVPDVPETLLPTVLRGAARTDLPSPDIVSTIEVPTLVLAWIDDPTHPVSTAERIHELLPDSRLVVARTPFDVTAWPGLFADHVSAHDAAAG